MFRWLTLAAVLTTPEWGSIAVPPSFRPAPDLPLLGTGAAAPGTPEGPARALAVFLEEGSPDAGTDAPLVMLSVVGSPMPDEGSLRDAVFSSTVAHFHQDLDIEAHVDRPAERNGHMEISAEITRPHADQTVRLGFYPAGARHYVVFAAFPTARAAELSPVLDAMFDSYGPPGVIGASPRSAGRWGLAAIVAIGLAAAVATRAWRRRRSKVVVPPEET